MITSSVIDDDTRMALVLLEHTSPREAEQQNTQISVCVCMDVCVCVCIHMHIYIYMCVCVCGYICECVICV